MNLEKRVIEVKLKEGQKVSSLRRITLFIGDIFIYLLMIMLVSFLINNKYINYMNNGRIIENFYYNDNLISVGIHNSRRKKGENTKVDKRN